MHQEDECHDRSEQAADKLDEARADEVAHAFDVAHDARYQQAGAVFVVEADRKTAYMLLHLLAQFRYHTLRRL